MTTQTKEDTSIRLGWGTPDGKGGEAHTTLGAMRRIASEMEGASPESEPLTAEEELARIGALRRELATLERRLEDATDRLKDSPEWDLVQGLKEDRKLLQKKLDRAIDGTVQWAQPRMI